MAAFGSAATPLTVPKSAPRPIKVTRWVCGGLYCTRSYSHRSSTETHMETCWKVPENRACQSCRHFQVYGYGHEGDRDWLCAIGVELVAGRAVAGCEKWEAAS